MAPIPPSSTPQHLTSKPDDESGGTEYEARGIFDERAAAGPSSNKRRARDPAPASGKEFLVDWAGTDERGMPYPPTWEPEGNCSAVLLGTWLKAKRADPEIVGRWVRERNRRKQSKRERERVRELEVKVEAASDEEQSSKRRKSRRSAEQGPSSTPASAQRTGAGTTADSPGSTSRSTRLRKGSTARPGGVAAGHRQASGSGQGQDSSQSPQVSRREESRDTNGNGESGDNSSSRTNGADSANGNGSGHSEAADAQPNKHSENGHASSSRLPTRKRYINLSDDDNNDDPSEIAPRPRKGKQAALVESAQTTQEAIDLRHSPDPLSGDADGYAAASSQGQEIETDPIAGLPESQAQAYYQLLGLMQGDGDEEGEGEGDQGSGAGSQARVDGEATNNAQRNKDPGGLVAATTAADPQHAPTHDDQQATVPHSTEDTAAPLQLHLAPTSSSQDAIAVDSQAGLERQSEGEIVVTVTKSQVTSLSQSAGEHSIVASTPQEASGSGERERSQAELPSPHLAGQVRTQQSDSQATEDSDVPDDVLMTDAETQAREQALGAAAEKGQALPGPSMSNAVASAQHATGTTAAELTAIQATLAQRNETITSLELQVQTLKASVKSVASDLEFHRTMYSDASNKAYALAGDLNESRAEVAKLKKQLDFGLKQRDLVYAGGFQARDDEINQLKAQVALLLQQSRQTDDRVRARAQDYPAALATIRKLQDDMLMQQATTRKYRQLAGLAEARARALLGKTFGKLPMVWDSADEDEEDGDFEGGEESEEDEDDGDDDTDEAAGNEGDEVTEPGLAASAALAPTEQATEQAIAEADAADLVATAAAVPAETTLAPTQQLSHDDATGWFMCKWAETPGVTCGMIFHTEQEFEAHVVVHV